LIVISEEKTMEGTSVAKKITEGTSAAKETTEEGTSAAKEITEEDTSAANNPNEKKGIKGLKLNNRTNMLIILITNIIFFYLKHVTDFLLKTKVEMIRLEIGYLKINIDENETIWRSSNEKNQSKRKGKEIEKSRIEIVSKKQRGLFTPEKSNINERSTLSAPTLTMAYNLHRLLLNLNKLPSPPPIKDLNVFQSNEWYIADLLRNLENIETDEEFDKFHGFLKVNDIKSSRNSIQNSENIQDLRIISEIELLKLSEKEFLNEKELAIKTLVSQIIKLFDKFQEDCIEEDFRRRSKLRCYVDILDLQHKIEIYCNLYKERKKGETLRQQAKKKIMTYSKPDDDSPSKINYVEFTNIIRAARRIKRLLNIVNNNWGIVDAFPNLDVNFFKSTSINVNNYERWLSLVEFNKPITEEEEKKRYQQNKMKEIKQRQENINYIYVSANLGELVQEVLSHTEWDVCC